MEENKNENKNEEEVKEVKEEDDSGRYMILLAVFALLLGVFMLDLFKNTMGLW